MYIQHIYIYRERERLQFVNTAVSQPAPGSRRSCLLVVLLLLVLLLLYRVHNNNNNNNNGSRKSRYTA